MTNATDTRAAFDAAQAALAATPTRELLTKAYQLTHRLDSIASKPRAYPRDEAAADVRAQRDMIDAELLRRTGDL